VLAQMEKTGKRARSFIRRKSSMDIVLLPRHSKMAAAVCLLAA
jgi:hypothetical protein